MMSSLPDPRDAFATSWPLSQARLAQPEHSEALADEWQEVTYTCWLTRSCLKKQSWHGCVYIPHLGSPKHSWQTAFNPISSYDNTGLLLGRAGHLHHPKHSTMLPLQRICSKHLEHMLTAVMTISTDYFTITVMRQDLFYLSRWNLGGKSKNSGAI